MLFRRRSIAKVEKLDINQKKFIYELIFAVILTIGCSLAGLSNLLWESNELYPYTVDGMGHMTKVVYITQQLSQGHIPSWFPYWYNGSTATQYYVPLSYYLMVPIYWLTDNIMITYKIFCVSVMTIGGLGVWAFCYKKIGRLCGLVGIIVYCFQPFLLASLYEAGLAAQGPIFAIMPWFLLLFLSCVDKPTKWKFAGSTLLVTSLILSHAMHAFMLCITTAIVLLIFLLMRKVTMKNLIISGTSIVLAGILTAFWSVVGATGLENPNVPYLLQEAALYYTATYHYFLPNDTTAVFYYSIVGTSMIVLAIIIYIISMIYKRNDDNHKYYGLAAILLSIVTIIFSFGMNLPGFQYMPMATSMVPGRILTYTAVVGAISSAYAIYMIWNFSKARFIFKLVAIMIVIAIIMEMNPLQFENRVISPKYYDSIADDLDVENAAFDKGRYQWYGAVSSIETFFPVQYDFYLSDGWNIEGTPHNQTLWNNNIAFSTYGYDYVAKQLAFWNIRYLLLYNGYEKFSEVFVNKLGFSQREEDLDAYSLYVSDQPSSYYLKDFRNTIILSSCLDSFGIMFPNVVKGRSNNIGDYSIDELLKYEVVYILEPEMKKISQKTELESMVTQLVNKGVKVIIEPVPSESYDIFDVHIVDEEIDTIPKLAITKEYPFDYKEPPSLINTQIGIIRSLYGLDEIYANFEQKDGEVQNAIIGTKNVGDGNVIFLGAHLSQYLESVYMKNYGLILVDDVTIHDSEIVKSIYNSIFEYLGVNENYLPEVFETVTEHQWDYQGGTFNYISKEDTEVTVSVTYTPRWAAYLDGKEIAVGQCENLITLKLPAGEHTVELKYGITIYGKIGYIISAIGLVLFILVLVGWNKIMHYMEVMQIAIIEYLQIPQNVKLEPLILVEDLNSKKVLLYNENIVAMKYEDIEDIEDIEDTKYTENFKIIKGVGNENIDNIEIPDSVYKIHKCNDDDGEDVDVDEDKVETSHIEIKESKLKNGMKIEIIELYNTDSKE